MEAKRLPGIEAGEAAAYPAIRPHHAGKARPNRESADEDVELILAVKNPA